MATETQGSSAPSERELSETETLRVLALNLGIANRINLDTFPSGNSRRVTDFGGIDQNAASSINLGGSGVVFNRPTVPGANLVGSPVAFAQPAVGSFNLGGSGIGSGQPSVVSFGVGGGGGFGRGQGATRVVEAPATPTVTKTITIDRFVTLADLAFHSVPVTLTDLVVKTATITSRQAIITPVDDRVALQTTVIVRPTSLTVTCTKHDYRIATEVAVDYVTITHTSYIIRQTTYTTTATQVSTCAATMVRTIVHTQRTTVTDYHTITNTVHGQAGGYYY